MTAFKLIPPRSATDLLASAGLEDGMTILANLCEAGVVKAYAQSMERVQPTGAREAWRDKRIPADVWRRIIAEGKIADVASGTVRLDGSPEFGGGPRYTLIGIRFDPASVGKAASDHGHDVPLPAIPMAQGPARARKVEKPVSDVQPPAQTQPLSPPSRALVPADAETVTVEQAMRMTGLGKTTIYAMFKDGRLEQRKAGRRTLVTVASVRLITG